MAKLYVTPEKLLTMELGADFDTLDTFKLASLCAQATAIVDSYCAVPRLPQVHDFRGGTITGETHDWRSPDGPFDIGQRRIYVMHTPVRTISQLRIFVSKQPIYQEIDTDHLIIGQTTGAIDIVALALMPSGLFNSLLIPNLGILAPQLEVNYTYGREMYVEGEELYPTDGQTFRAENQWWFDDPAPAVYVNGEEVTEDFGIDFSEGTVVFESDLGANDIVTADYTHKLPNEIMQASGHIAAFLRSGSNIRTKGLERLSSIQVETVRITRAAPVHTEDLDLLIPEAASLLAGYKADGLVVR